MAGINGIGGLPDPAPARPSSTRDRKNEIKPAQQQDGVTISPEAQEAAGLARLVQAANTGPDIRADRVAAARENIERGDYRRPDVIAKVAERISRLFD